MKENQQTENSNSENEAAIVPAEVTADVESKNKDAFLLTFTIPAKEKIGEARSGLSSSLYMG